MAEYVQSGDKIQASQYNALVDAMVGPQNATTDQPFTQTKNGVVINGGLGRQTTKAASTVPAMFEVSYGNGYVGAGYSTYQQGDIDTNRFNGVFLNIGSWDTLAYNGFVLGNGVVMPTIPALAIIDPTSNNAAVVVYNQALADTIATGKLPLCTGDKDAGYAFVQIVDNGTAGKARNGDFVLLVGDFTKLGGSSGSDIKTVSFNNLRATVRGINLYENCEDLRVVQGGVLWRHNVIAGVAGSNIPHLSYTVGTQYVSMLPDSYVNRENIAEETVWPNATMDVKLKSIAVIPPQQLGFTQLQSTNTLELYHFDKLSSDISTYYDLSSEGLSCYDVLVKHKNPHPKTEDDPTYEGQAEADLEYVAISCLVPPGDTNVNKDNIIDTSLSSVELATINGNAFYELYGFQNNGTLSPSDLSGSGIEVVVRDSHSTGGNGARVNYVDLSTITESLSGGTSISGDHNVIPGYSNSIDTKKDSRGTYHQLYGFENPSTRNFYQLTEGKYQFVIRDYNSQDKYVVYSDISSFVNNLVISGDANIPATRTINLANENGRKFYKLYNWQGNNHVPLTAEIKADGEIHYINEVNGNPGPKHLLFENHQTGELEYHALGIKIPKIELSGVEGGDEIIQNITVISADLSALSADLSALDNFWVKGEDSQENYGSSIGDSGKSTVINLDTKRLNGTWYTDNGDFNVGGTCFARKLETSTVLQIGSTTINETQLQQLLALLNP